MDFFQFISLFINRLGSNFKCKLFSTRPKNKSVGPFFYLLPFGQQRALKILTGKFHTLTVHDFKNLLLINHNRYSYPDYQNVVYTHWSPNDSPNKVSKSRDFRPFWIWKSLKIFVKFFHENFFEDLLIFSKFNDSHSIVN